MGSDELAVTLARLEGKVDNVVSTVQEVREDVKAQGTTILGMSLQQARTEERLESGAKTFEALRVERAACEQRCKDALSVVAADAGRKIQAAAEAAAKDLATSQEKVVTKAEVFGTAFKLLGAGGAGGAVVLGIVKAIWG